MPECVREECFACKRNIHDELCSCGSLCVIVGVVVGDSDDLMVCICVGWCLFVCLFVCVYVLAGWRGLRGET